MDELPQLPVKTKATAKAPIQLNDDFYEPVAVLPSLHRNSTASTIYPQIRPQPVLPVDDVYEPIDMVDDRPDASPSVYEYADGTAFTDEKP